MPRLKIRGTWSGLLEDVALHAWTVLMLREEVATRANCSPDSIMLTFAGKILKDDDADADAVRSLASLGVKNNSKILATRISPQERDAFRREEPLLSRLEEIWEAANAIMENHPDELSVEDINREIEDRSGQLVDIDSELERRAVVLGARLHAMAVNLIGFQLYEDALEALCSGEEAFSICDPNLVELIYIVPVLHINMLWCYLMKRDGESLSNAGKILKMARTGIERDHVKIFLSPKLLENLHLRLELLEGVVAFHSGQIVKSRKALLSAKVKLIQHLNLHGSTFFRDLSFTPDEADKALRMCNGDVAAAIDFVIEEDAKDKCNNDNQTRNEIREGKLYGLTPSNKPVDIEKLKEMVSIGFDKELAAEALRRNENDTQKALDDLRNPETNSTLQVDIESMKRERQKKTTDLAIERAVQIGFERSRVVAAFEAGGTSEEVIQRLKVQPQGPSDISKVEEKNKEIEETENDLYYISIEICTLYDGLVIYDYLFMIECLLRELWEDDPSEHDEKEG
ncbi:hypothetical protein PIB30_021426 [Stylosanthes scabra]|uniref:UBA domain-containing protein n=1 Tax=Stylosanthes scabra TaxID=79078 RepID=A0ABU6UBL1_9FABA|nr:hypothetical protein [Stylosanthes scabra]